MKRDRNILLHYSVTLEGKLFKVIILVSFFITELFWNMILNDICILVFSLTSKAFQSSSYVSVLWNVFVVILLVCSGYSGVISTETASLEATVHLPSSKRPTLSVSC